MGGQLTATATRKHTLNPELDKLQTYPFQKLSALLEGAIPNAALKPISLYIGEPKHPTPAFIKQSLIDNLDGLAVYPATAGTDVLRTAIAKWANQRYHVTLDPVMQVLPVTGSREALFSFAQAVIDPHKPDPVVVCPNPSSRRVKIAALVPKVAVIGALMNEAIDELYASYSYLYPFINEANYLPGTDNGASYTMDKIHPNAYGFALLSVAQARAILTNTWQ